MLRAGDVVKYLGMDGVYMDGVPMTRGDTGVVIDIGKPGHYKDRMVSVRLFRYPDQIVALPRGFWCRI